jgi:hypothetical protein
VPGAAVCMSSLRYTRMPRQTAWAFAPARPRRRRRYEQRPGVRRHPFLESGLGPASGDRPLFGEARSGVRSLADWRSGGRLWSAAASARTMAQAMVVALPGRREPSRRRAFEGRGWLGVEGIGAPDQVLCRAAKASAASRHQSSIAAVIQRVSSWCMAVLLRRSRTVRRGRARAPRRGVRARRARRPAWVATRTQRHRRRSDSGGGGVRAGRSR